MIPRQSHLELLIVESRLQRLHHGVLGEGTLQPDQVGDLGQVGPLHVLRLAPLPPPLSLWRRSLRGGRRLAEADVGVVVLEAVLEAAVCQS